MAEVFQKHPYRWTRSSARSAPPRGGRARAAQFLDPLLRAEQCHARDRAIERDGAKSSRPSISIGCRRKPIRRACRRPPAGHFLRRTITLKDDSAPAPGVGAMVEPSPPMTTITSPSRRQAVGGGDSSRLYRELVADKQLPSSLSRPRFRSNTTAYCRHQRRSARTIPRFSTSSRLRSERSAKSPSPKKNCSRPKTRAPLDAGPTNKF